MVDPFSQHSHPKGARTTIQNFISHPALNPSVQRGKFLVYLLVLFAGILIGVLGTMLVYTTTYACPTVKESVTSFTDYDPHFDYANSAQMWDDK